MHPQQCRRNLSHRLSGKIIATCGIVLALTLSGCGRSYDEPRFDVYPVKGKVVYKGKPLENAKVVLIAEDPKLFELVRPSGKTSADGTFALETYTSGDGAPSGKFKAVITRNQVVTSGGSAVALPNDLPKKYASPETSDLVVEIGTGPTELPTFELK